MTTAKPEALGQLTPPDDRRSVAGAVGVDDRVAVRWPALALGTVVAVAALAYGAVAQLVPMPVLNPDELRYTLAARALADGEWLSLRGHDYGYGTLYPIVLAPIVALSESIEAAYPFFKVANALLRLLTR